MELLESGLDEIKLRQFNYKDQKQLEHTYEVMLYRVYKDRSELIDSRFIQSNRPLKCEETTVINRKDYNIIMFITKL